MDRYRVEDVDDGDDKDGRSESSARALESLLNDREVDGWELVHLYRRPMSRLRLIFRRG